MSVGTWPSGVAAIRWSKTSRTAQSEGDTDDRIRRSTTLQILPLGRIHPSL
jgi:hypothetical protein